MKKIFVLDNGGQPFLVHISGKNVSVFTYDEKEEEEEYDIIYEDKVAHFTNIAKIFIGKDDSHGPNTVLLHLKPSLKDKFFYVFIGPEIYSFTTKERIQSFKSPVHGAAVPYPYAETKSYMYFFSFENSYVEKKYFSFKKDIIDEFYEIRKAHEKKFRKKMICKRKY